MKSLKALVKQSMPVAWGVASRAWHQSRQRRFERRMKRISDDYIKNCGLVVRHGPFAGMTYVSKAFSSMALPKLIGSYEAELHESLGRLFTKNYATVVDVGCAEGYYAVGLAMRFPTARVHAFDLDPDARQLCEKVAIANRVDGRVSVQGGCDVDCLKSLPLEHALIFCDCDGYELALLDPTLVPALALADLVIETHDCYNPIITSTLVARFTPTHDIELIDSVPRDPAPYLELEFLSRSDRSLAVNEIRPPQQWAFMTPRESNQSSPVV